MADAGERERLRRRLREAGLDEAAISRAAEEGRLPTLAVELALGGQGRHTLTAVARASGVSTSFLRELLQALGRPNPSRGERLFTDEDVVIAQGLRRMLDTGMPRRDLLEVVRVAGQALAQVADAVQRAAGDALLQPGDSEAAVGLRFAEASDELSPLAPPLLDYVFRTHLREGIGRAMITEAEREAGRLAGTREVAVAFADLVGYTRLGGRVDAEEVGRIAGRLAELATRAVCPPARVVKTIGDAAMIVSPDAPALVETLERLRTAAAADGDSFPPLRIGASWGPATPRGGDWFGATVNVASRLADVAKPGQVVVTEALRDQAPDLPWRRRRKRSLKGVDSRLRLYSLEEAGAAADEG